MFVNLVQINLIFSDNVCTVKSVLKGTFGTKKKWPYKTGDLLKEVQFI